MNRNLHSKASCYFNFFDLIRQDAKNSLRAISSAKHSAIMKIPRVLRASLRLCGVREERFFGKERSNQAPTSDPEVGTQFIGMWQ